LARYEFDAPRLHLDAPLTAGASLDLSKEQANYLGNVLRLKEGDGVLVFNGRDGEWLAKISGARRALSLGLERQTRAQETGPDLDYLFAPLKHARLDYMVQKAVEMGVRRLRPVLTRRTQATRVNLDRMQANAVEAAEQCGILTVAEVLAEEKLDRVLAHWPAERLLICCDEDAAIADPVAALAQVAPAIAAGRGGLALLIGPEGGFDPQEREMIRTVPGVMILSLGPRILRADTAAVAALAVVQAVLGDWRG
jgi:16S rRNA (uracil1498-N3)-methyltransferase